MMEVPAQEERMAPDSLDAGNKKPRRPGELPDDSDDSDEGRYVADRTIL